MVTARRKMKIAVIDHIGNPGGGSRVTRALLPAMKQVRPELDITFFGNPHSMKREQLDQVAKPWGIQLKGLSSAKLAGQDIMSIRGSRHVINLFQRKFAHFLSTVSFYLSGAVHKELEAVVKGFDLAFFVWPFHLRCPMLDCPMAGIFHDFNFKYFFSGQTMAPWVLELLNQEMPRWLSRATPIVSTDFMRTELGKFYPEYREKTHVVPVAPTSLVSSIDKQKSKEIVAQRFNIRKSYLLCPTNIGSHKNIGTLLAAFPLLKSRGHDVQLVFTGSGTEILNGRAGKISLELGCEPQDVFGLGYVSNEEIDALIQNALAVVNPSLYEGGNVPGFDAWARGVPVAMSHIPTFLEHLTVHQVHAKLFNPRSPEDIAEKLDEILSHPEQAKKEAEDSQQAISHFTWEKTAEGYLKIFDSMLLALDHS
jgi:glycosyltransferase involved in cell wall biosynthesis